MILLFLATFFFGWQFGILWIANSIQGQGGNIKHIGIGPGVAGIVLLIVGLLIV